MGDRRNKNIQYAGSMKENDMYRQQLQRSISLEGDIEQTHELKSFETVRSDTHSISTTKTQIPVFEVDTPSSSKVDFPEMPYTTLKVGEDQHNLGVEDFRPCRSLSLGTQRGKHHQNGPLLSFTLSSSTTSESNWGKTDLGSTLSLPNLSSNTSKSKQYQHDFLRMEDLCQYQFKQYQNSWRVDKDPPWIPPITPLKEQKAEGKCSPNILDMENVQSHSQVIDEELTDKANSGEREQACVSESITCALKDAAICNLLPLIEESLYAWWTKGKIDPSRLKAQLLSATKNFSMSLAKTYLPAPLGTIVERLMDESFLDLFKRWGSGDIRMIITDILCRRVCQIIGWYGVSCACSFMSVNPIAAVGVQAVTNWLGPKFGKLLYDKLACMLWSSIF